VERTIDTVVELGDMRHRICSFCKEEYLAMEIIPDENDRVKTIVRQTIWNEVS
jgi:hypothetical protein